jgi:hypothetical protein
MSVPWNAIIYGALTVAESIADVTTALMEAKRGDIITVDDIKRRRAQTLKAFATLDKAMGIEAPMTPDEGNNLLHEKETTND